MQGTRQAAQSWNMQLPQATLCISLVPRLIFFPPTPKGLGMILHFACAHRVAIALVDKIVLVHTLWGLKQTVKKREMVQMMTISQGGTVTEEMGEEESDDIHEDYQRILN